MMDYTNSCNNVPAKTYHAKADVRLKYKQLLINGRTYQIIANEKNALDLDLMQKKYDPFLDQYDFIVGDISSEHLRLKGFYSDDERVSIDKRASTIVDYLEEYCNPNSPYFILQLMGDNTIKEIVLGRKYKHYYKYFGNQNNYFKEKKVKKIKFKSHKNYSVKISYKHNRQKKFVIRKRKG